MSVLRIITERDKQVRSYYGRGTGIFLKGCSVINNPHIARLTTTTTTTKTTTTATTTTTTTRFSAFGDQFLVQKVPFSRKQHCMDTSSRTKNDFDIKLKKGINNSRRKFKRNTFLISVFICDKDFSRFA